jgi:hypothetical protein
MFNVEQCKDVVRITKNRESGKELSHEN